jgi:xanthine dehydrogenase accessory factor
MLQAVTQGITIDILTVMECTPNTPELLGNMIVVYADGRIDSSLSHETTNELLESIQQSEWEKPVLHSVHLSTGQVLQIFWDRIINQPNAIIFGGGHISQPLVEILSLLDFNITVIDDRPEYANQARFPNAQQVICDNFRSALQRVIINENSAVIIVTRGHRYDLDCLRGTMHTNPKYLGMIGSKRRVREILELLREEGVLSDLESRLMSPIGLNIKAETPAEIAVSIAAEVIWRFRGGYKRPFDRQRGEL